MFVSIKLLDNELNFETKQYNLTYLLEDTDFVIKLNTPIETTVYDNRGDASIIPSGLIHAYTKMNRNVPKNLALFYMKSFGSIPIPERNRLLRADLLWTEEYFPVLQYKNKYFRCVINQMNVLHYTGRAKYEKSVA